MTQPNIPESALNAQTTLDVPPLISAVEEAPINVSGRPARIHVDARGAALTLLATVAFVFALHAASKFLIPLLFGILISYTLNPLVVWLQRLRIPRVIGATLVMLALIGAMFAVMNTLRGEFQSIIERLPEATTRLSAELNRMRKNQPGTLQQMQQAAAELERATSQAAGAPAVSKRPVAEQSMFRLSEWLLAGSMNAASLLAQMTMVLFLVFFLLLSGDTFKRKLVKLTGPTLSDKKITVNILDDINTSIQNYMFMLLVTNVLLALLSWLAFRWIGLENAGAWALTAGLLHVIPYFGPLLITASTALTAFMQFGELSKVLLVAGASLAIATVVGTFVTTWMTGRIAKMNAAAVFIGLLFWAWMWGVWGMLLGIPIIVIVKVVSEHIDGWQPVAELLGD